MRKQYHFWPGPAGLDAWDVDRLVELTAGFPVVDVAIADIGELDSAYWSEPGAGPQTVREILTHVQLIEAADLSFPVILGFDNRVMDGMHRIAKAVLADHDTIRAVRFPAQPAPDYRNVAPADLPY